MFLGATRLKGVYFFKFLVTVIIAYLLFIKKPIN